MASLLKISFAFLALAFILQQGGALARPVKCSTSSLVITQVKTGRWFEGKPEYEVTVTNKCRCSQSKVVALCYGLSSVVRVNQQAIKPMDENDCVINGGRAIPGGSQVKFKYAWMTPQDFPLVSSQTKC